MGFMDNADDGHIRKSTGGAAWDFQVFFFKTDGMYSQPERLLIRRICIFIKL
jgi:hypothetical protein